MNRLSKQRQAQIVQALCEGNSLRSTSRMASVSINTVVKLLIDLGTASAEYQDGVLRNLTCRRIQCDEIWSFCYAKEKNVPDEHKGEFGYGDVWTWTAIDADSKLVLSWLVGGRDSACAKAFIEDVAGRLANRVQLTTDGHKAYLEAVEGAFGTDIDYAMLIKLYGPEPESAKRYSPAACIGAETRVITGNPDQKHVSTSYSERQNLTMRMSMRRFTRLTNAFSKKLENHMHALALYFMHYNFSRPHTTLSKTNKSYPTTPAMAAGLTDHVWTIQEVVGLLDSN
ncbi:MAG: IS1 family transposase [Chloroflexota bacterium]